MAIFPQFNAGGNTASSPQKSNNIQVSSFKTDSAMIAETVQILYDSLKLQKYGLKKDVFAYAYRGYHNLRKKRTINKDGILTICDFSQSSRRKRLYLIDFVNYKVLLNTHVAHGKNSGGEYARKFSNRPESLQSSLGFYVTKRTYWGEHGLALVIDGLEKGFNDKIGR